MTANTNNILETLKNLNLSVWGEKKMTKLCWGLNSLGCLAYLHGKTGATSPKTPEWITSLSKEKEAMIDWGKGRIRWESQGKTREMKLGKWLRKNGSPQQLKEFEERKPEFVWEISSNPWDILTMSHNRSWTSCMRPEGSSEEGLFSDMRAGAAVVFWFRPGAAQPCGREILRPVARNGMPEIVRGGVTYGNGGELSEEELSAACGLPVSKIPLGEARVVSIRHEIYDDNSKEGWSQSSKEIERSEEVLLYAFREKLVPSDLYPEGGEETKKKRNRKPFSAPSWNPHGGRRNGPIRHVQMGEEVYGVYDSWTESWSL